MGIPRKDRFSEKGRRHFMWRCNIPLPAPGRILHDRLADTSGKRDGVLVWVLWKADTKTGVDTQEVYWGSCLWRMKGRTWEGRSDPCTEEGRGGGLRRKRQHRSEKLLARPTGALRTKSPFRGIWVSKERPHQYPHVLGNWLGGAQLWLNSGGESKGSIGSSGQWRSPERSWSERSLSRLPQQGTSSVPSTSCVLESQVEPQ